MGISNHMRLIVTKGDITEQQVDAIVNAANSSLLGGGGVDGAIHRRGGAAILEECRRLRAGHLGGGLPVGHAVATTAGSLPSRWVIHTVGPVHSAREDRGAQLASCYHESLRLAQDLGAESVAFPAISTGVYRWPLDDAARIAAEAIRAAEARVAEIRLVLFDDTALTAFREAFDDA
ncbi:O-acetyl-ADP-ribose deacetylase [Nocardiopsis sp. YSL2]|uniref:O-acetyl-ADP-ribose deacetylase n=1 Tax=Nocardiopsis sp. YSL2 TaxID=2939492 RepID=UPI0026F42558|nr:O-acetyl-ADP-ribose deacetylase [Nocardiopsis sp. YSL2]